MTWLERRIENFIRSIRDDPNKKRIPIGPNSEDPTYWRWFVWPRNRFVNCYLHNFRQDDEEDLHDHRMINISFLLQGEYFDEHFIDSRGRLTTPTLGCPLPRTGRTLVREHRFRFRLPSWPHRVVLLRDAAGNPIPCWSLFIGFPHWKNWGFYCPGADRRTATWVPWQKYIGDVDPTSAAYGKVGKGCDQ